MARRLGYCTGEGSPRGAVGNALGSLYLQRLVRCRSRVLCSDLDVRSASALNLTQTLTRGHDARWKSTKAITRFGSHFTNTATASVRPARIYRYTIKTPNVLVYIFPVGGTDPPDQQTQRLASKANLSFPNVFRAPFPGTIPDMLASYEQ